jgi:hypothetical protein
MATARPRLRPLERTTSSTRPLQLLLINPQRTQRRGAIVSHGGPIVAEFPYLYIDGVVDWIEAAVPPGSATIRILLHCRARTIRRRG